MLQITGIHRTGKDIMDTMYVSMKVSDDEFREVQLFFDDDDKKDWRGSRRGCASRSSVGATGPMGNVLIKDCQIVR